MHVYTPTPNRLGTANVPDDGDLEDASSVNTPIEAALDGIAYLDTLADNLLVSIQHTTPLYKDSEWSLGGGDVAPILIDSGSSGSTIFQPIKLPRGAKLTSLSMWVKGGSGHGGSLPAVMPTLVVAKRTMSSGGLTVIRTFTDPSASVVAYELRHILVAGGMNETITDNTDLYGVYFTSESGAGAQVGLQYETGIQTSCNFP